MTSLWWDNFLCFSRLGHACQIILIFITASHISVNIALSSMPCEDRQLTWSHSHRLYCIMMTSSNGTIFRVTGPLCGEFTCHRWKDQWRGDLMFSLSCAWINGWVNNREAGDLRRHRGQYDVTVIPTGFIVLLDVDECSSFSTLCSGGGQCVNTEGSFTCTCPEGFTLDTSATKCIGEGL